jgi:hypothetical protein
MIRGVRNNGDLAPDAALSVRTYWDTSTPTGYDAE